MKIAGHEIHPVAACYRLLEGDELDALVEDIGSRGQRDPVLVEEGTGLVLDGRNRLRACELAFRDPWVREVTAEEVAGDVVAYVKSRNLHRRHDSDSQKAMAAARHVVGGHFANLQKAAEAFGVSERTVYSAAALVGHEKDTRGRPRQGETHPAAPDVVAAVDAGWLAVSTAAELTRLAPEDQLAVLEEAAGDGRRVRALLQARERCAQCDNARHLDELGEVPCPACNAPDVSGLASRSPIEVDTDVDEEFVQDDGDDPPEDLERARAVELSQWFTPAELARQMVGLARIRPGECVLEPSAGTGALVSAIRETVRSVHVTVHEIDHELWPHLREVADVVHEGDFLEAAVPSRPYDVSLGNPPYENGLDGRFVEHSMNCARVVTKLLRTNALHGSDRFARVWSRVVSGEFWLTDIRYLSKRPFFEGPTASGGAKSDFVAVRLERVEGGRPGRTEVGWW